VVFVAIISQGAEATLQGLSSFAWLVFLFVILALYLLTGYVVVADRRNVSLYIFELAAHCVVTPINTSHLHSRAFNISLQWTLASKLLKMHEKCCIKLVLG